MTRFRWVGVWKAQSRCGTHCESVLTAWRRMSRSIWGEHCYTYWLWDGAHARNRMRKRHGFEVRIVSLSISAHIRVHRGGMLQHRSSPLLVSIPTHSEDTYHAKLTIFQCPNNGQIPILKSYCVDFSCLRWARRENISDGRARDVESLTCLANYALTVKDAI